jgi:hypothetical protein
MSSSGVDDPELQLDARATRAVVTDDTLTVELEDGRTIVTPTAWFPRLKHGTAAERANLEISGLGIHWRDLDEDISVRGLLLGRKSDENPKILKWWLGQRAKGRSATYEDYMREKHKGSAASRKRSRKAG